MCSRVSTVNCKTSRFIALSAECLPHQTLSPMHSRMQLVSVHISPHYTWYWASLLVCSLSSLGHFVFHPQTRWRKKHEKHLFNEEFGRSRGNLARGSLVWYEEKCENQSSRRLCLRWGNYRFFPQSPGKLPVSRERQTLSAFVLLSASWTTLFLITTRNIFMRQFHFP